MVKQKPWRDFEVLLATIHRKLAEGAHVTHNSHVVGRSGRRRQIDILISQTIGLYEARIVVECKRYERRVTIDKVEAFAAKLTDVGASQGVMISGSGFDDGAKAVATQGQITLLTYREATDLDWRQATGVSAWARIIATRIELVSMSTDLPSESNHSLEANATVSDVRTGASVSLGDFATSILRESPLQQRPGEYVLEFEAEEPFRIVARDTPYEVRLLRLTFRVRAFEYLENLSLGSGHVLAEPSSGNAKYQEYTSKAWDIHDILASHPVRELTPETFDEASSQGKKVVVVDPRKLKRYIRFVFSKHGGQEDVPANAPQNPTPMRRSRAASRRGERER